MRCSCNCSRLTFKHHSNDYFYTRRVLFPRPFLNITHCQFSSFFPVAVNRPEPFDGFLFKEVDSLCLGVKFT